MCFANAEHGYFLESTRTTSFDHYVFIGIINHSWYFQNLSYETYSSGFLNLINKYELKYLIIKKELLYTKKKSVFIKGTMRSLETSKMNLRQIMIDLY